MSTTYLDNYYARLGVPKNASAEEIRSAYHLAARRLHPDTSDDPTTTELFLQIQQAYETLSDRSKRRTYDASLPPDIDPPTEIMINSIYSRPALSHLQDSQLVYVLLDMMAKPSEETNEKNAPLNISLVIDTSTSMAGSRMDMVKASATQLLRQLRPDDSLAITTFNDRASVIVSASRNHDFKTLESQISLLTTGGGTEIYEGLKKGVAEVSRNLSLSSHNHIILITDGRTYGDEQKCLDLAGEISKKSVTISGLGIGSEWNDEFLDTLTAMTGGNCVYAQHPKEIRTYFEKKFTRLSNTFADKVSMELRTGKDVELRYAFRLSPDPAPLNTDGSITLGAIPHGPSLSVLLEFIVNPFDPDLDNVTLAEGGMDMYIPARQIPNLNSRFSFDRPVRMSPDPEPPPQALVKAMSRLSLYRMQDQARRELSNGEVEKATRRLQNLATQLLMSGQPELAQTVMLELKEIETGSLLNHEAKKKIKYGTRALLLPPGEDDLQQ